MSRILVIFASHYGQTCAVAQRLAQRLREAHHTVDVVDVRDGSGPVPPEDYDVVILGSRVELGRFASRIAGYIHEHRTALQEMPTAFFSVSMAAADGPQGIDHDPTGYMATLFEEVHWHPTVEAAFAGALPYRKYGWVMRQVMKRISKAGGHTTDTSHNHVFTDMAAVDALADRLATTLGTRETMAYA